MLYPLPLLYCLFLVFGCLAILKGRLELADTFRQLSSVALLGAAILPPCLSS